MQVKIFTGLDPETMEAEINDLLVNKVKEIIKISTTPYSEYGFSCIIFYEEKEETTTIKEYVEKELKEYYTFKDGSWVTTSTSPYAEPLTIKYDVSTDALKF